MYLAFMFQKAEKANQTTAVFLKWALLGKQNVSCIYVLESIKDSKSNHHGISEQGMK